MNLVGECDKEPAIGPSEPVRLQDLLCRGQRSDHPQRECAWWVGGQLKYCGLMYTRIDVNSLGLFPPKYQEIPFQAFAKRGGRHPQCSIFTRFSLPTRVPLFSEGRYLPFPRLHPQAPNHTSGMTPPVIRGDEMTSASPVLLHYLR